MSTFDLSSLASKKSAKKIVGEVLKNESDDDFDLWADIENEPVDSEDLGPKHRSKEEKDKAKKVFRNKTLFALQQFKYPKLPEDEYTVEEGMPFQIITSSLKPITVEKIRGAEPLLQQSSFDSYLKNRIFESTFKRVVEPKSISVEELLNLEYSEEFVTSFSSYIKNYYSNLRLNLKNETFFNDFIDFYFLNVNTFQPLVNIVETLYSYIFPFFLESLHTFQILVLYNALSVQKYKQIMDEEVYSDDFTSNPFILFPEIKIKEIL